MLTREYGLRPWEISRLNEFQLRAYANDLDRKARAMSGDPEPARIIDAEDVVPVEKSAGIDTSGI